MQDSRSPLTELQVAVIPNLIQIDELDEPAGCHPQRCLGLRSGFNLHPAPGRNRTL